MVGGVFKAYGNERLLISQEGKLYQAGENLEENLNQLKTLCMFKIEKVCTNSARHVTPSFLYLRKEKKVRILKQDEMDGESCIIDVRTVNVKRKKGKLFLTDRGDGPVVYKLKKAKLEQNINFGFI